MVVAYAGLIAGEIPGIIGVIDREIDKCKLGNYTLDDLTC